MITWFKDLHSLWLLFNSNISALSPSSPCLILFLFHFFVPWILHLILQPSDLFVFVPKSTNCRCFCDPRIPKLCKSEALSQMRPHLYVCQASDIQRSREFSHLNVTFIIYCNCCQSRSDRHRPQMLTNAAVQHIGMHCYAHPERQKVKGRCRKRVRWRMKIHSLGRRLWIFYFSFPLSSSMKVAFLLFLLLKHRTYLIWTLQPCFKKMCSA